MNKYWTVLLCLISANFASAETLSLNLNGIQKTFIKVPAGTFTMGSTTEIAYSQRDERPTSEVTISEDFYLAQTELSQKLWESVMHYNPSVFKGENMPVDMISWDDSMRFIDKLNELWEGEGTFRMPTEAEWEYAARLAEPPIRDETGEINIWEFQKFAWFNSRAEGRAHPMGTKQADMLGFYDLFGNHWEWCSDWKGDYTAKPKVDPQGPETGTHKIYRGGSWFNEPQALRPENRNAHPPEVPFTNASLRLVYVHK